jgi:hypothetical protein
MLRVLGGYVYHFIIAVHLVTGIIAAIVTFRWETAFAQVMAAKAVHSVSFLVSTLLY